MRILIVGNFGTSWDGSICDEEHIAMALLELGHEVTRWQRESVFTDIPLNIKYDFALIAQWNGYQVDLVEKIHLSAHKTVYWAFDYQFHSMEEWHKRLVQTCDIFLTKEAEHIPFYKQLAPDTKVHWLPADFAPGFLADNKIDVAEEDKDIDVLFTGTYLPWCEERTNVLKAVDEKFNLQVYSMTPEPWKAQGLKNVYPAVVDLQLPALISRARINLSIDLYHSDGFWSDRNAQIMACGGFVLFRHVPLSELVFYDYVEYFYDIEDCLEKIDFYLQSPRLRATMSKSGHEYADLHLTAFERASAMLTLVRGLL